MAKEGLRKTVKRNMANMKTMKAQRVQSQKNRQRGVASAFKSTKGGIVAKTKAAIKTDAMLLKTITGEKPPKKDSQFYGHMNVSSAVKSTGGRPQCEGGC